MSSMISFSFRSECERERRRLRGVSFVHKHGQWELYIRGEEESAINVTLGRVVALVLVNDKGCFATSRPHCYSHWHCLSVLGCERTVCRRREDEEKVSGYKKCCHSFDLDQFDGGQQRRETYPVHTYRHITRLRLLSPSEGYK